MDSQSVKAAASVPAGSRGYDGGKKINGRRRHVITDCLGMILMVLVTAHPLPTGRRLALHHLHDPPVVRREHRRLHPLPAPRHHRPGHRLRLRHALHLRPGHRHIGHGLRPELRQSLGQLRHRRHPTFQHLLGSGELGQHPLGLRSKLLHPHPSRRFPPLHQPHRRRTTNLRTTEPEHDARTLPRRQ
ncbi:hypothetical protein [Streptomyces sp. NPDC051364]|uniref:hypothetical protein n=1 Tax=Streptomyces sp. NPDC051364 TaxID=3155799 RepID=UPI00343873AC